jgi:hypothetical protein
MELYLVLIYALLLPKKLNPIKKKVPRAVYQFVLECTNHNNGIMLVGI